MPNNWNNVQEFSDRPKLPLGAYVCKIKKAAVQKNTYGDQLCILFDIAEGEYGGFYDRDFKANSAQDKKWKGVLRLWLPTDDGSENDETTKRVLKGMVTSVEKSNPGYQWDWNEASLAGKMIGILFRNEEWEFKGKKGWTVRPFRAMSVDTARSGDFTLPNDKPLKNSAAAEPSYSNYGSNFAELDDDDAQLPF